jgi:hypothetical protein
MPNFVQDEVGTAAIGFAKAASHHLLQPPPRNLGCIRVFATLAQNSVMRVYCHSGTKFCNESVLPLWHKSTNALKRVKPPSICEGKKLLVAVSYATGSTRVLCGKLTISP